jgi:hypothetical protein
MGEICLKKVGFSFGFSGGILYNDNVTTNKNQSL